MDTMQTLLSHRSIRKYKDEPIPESVLNKIIEAAIRTSTTGNMQLYSIIITKDLEKRKAVRPFHFGQEIAEKAPVLLTFCADFNRFNKWCRLRDAEPGYDNFLSFTTAAIDALIAAQNACVAAEAQGLGICYLGTTTYMAHKLIEFYKLPKGVVPMTTITLGYPDENPGLVDRLSADAVIHHEEYKDYTDEDINKIFAEKENMELYKGFVKENNVPSLAHVFTDVRYKKADNEHFSQVFMDVLKDQGFI
jgi:nitroreductase